jgi:hypothetical protein
MKVREIVSTLSAVVPVGAYENLKPGFEIRMELAEGDDMDAAFKYANGYIKNMLEVVSNNAKADLIQKQYANIRLYEKDGKKYPSVTSILGWDVDWKITEDELQQYGSRGTIVHKLIEVYLSEKKWVDPLDIPELENDVAVLMGGSKKLSWKDCSYVTAIESLAGDLKLLEQEAELYNDENLYAGRVDVICLYKGKKTIMDFKSGTTTDMRQLAAYAACVEGIEQLVIVPVGPTDNKSGLKKPVVCTDIAGEYKKFLYARAKFRERFGI